jgi:thiamine biosynthesis protein ThiS
MNVFVNGRERNVPQGITLSELLKLLELPEGRIAVERNREVVPRSLHDRLKLSEGDRLELVRFVGGG